MGYIDMVNIPDQTFISHKELMSVLMSIQVSRYQPPVANQLEIMLFIEELTAQLEESHIDEYNAIVLGDFFLDQMHDPYIDFFNDILTCFAFNKHSNYSLHIYGGILDLVFHNRKQTPEE